MTNVIKLISVFVIATSLGGCATVSPSIPKGYNGPTATIKDTVKPYSASKADFFYLAEIDGRTIEDSRSKTLQVNYGHGMNMTPAIVERVVPAKPSTFTIVGRTEYAAPILALTSTVYQVKGQIQLSPEKDQIYLVRGELGENYSAVWLEEEVTHQIVGEKIEVHGSAKLGTFEK